MPGSPAHLEMAAWPDRNQLHHALATAAGPRCVLLADVWNVAGFNYRFGPDRGDILLVHVWNAMCKAVAPHPVFRLGGDDFVAVLPAVAAPQLERLKSAITAGLEAAQVAALEGADLPASWPWWIEKDRSVDTTLRVPVGMTFGIACGEGSDELVARAVADYEGASRRHRAR